MVILNSTDKFQISIQVESNISDKVFNSLINKHFLMKNKSELIKSNKELDFILVESNIVDCSQIYLLIINTINQYK